MVYLKLNLTNFNNQFFSACLDFLLAKRIETLAHTSKSKL